MKAGEFQGRFLCVKNMPRMLDLFLWISDLGMVIARRAFGADAFLELQLDRELSGARTT